MIKCHPFNDEVLPKKSPFYHANCFMAAVTTLSVPLSLHLLALLYQMLCAYAVGSSFITRVCAPTSRRQRVLILIVEISQKYISSNSPASFLLQMEFLDPKLNLVFVCVFSIPKLLPVKNATFHDTVVYFRNHPNFRSGS